MVTLASQSLHNEWCNRSAIPFRAKPALLLGSPHTERTLKIRAAANLWPALATDAIVRLWPKSPQLRRT
jgi:hypothetical protein